MNNARVKFKFLDAPYRFLKYSVNNFEYKHYELLLDEIYFEFVTEDEKLLSAIQSNQNKEIEVECYAGNTITTYTLIGYLVKNITVTKESWDKPYVYTVKISSTGIQNVKIEYTEIGFENEKKENENMKKSINSIFEEAFEQEKRREAGILTPKIESIYANKEKGTIVIKWQDNTYTKVTCDPKDTWDIEKGIAMAIAKKSLGNNWNAYTIIDKYIKSVKYTESSTKEKKPAKKTKKTA
jgi:hypothetical protein